MAHRTPEEGFEILKDRVQESIRGLFPIAGKRQTLELKDVQVKDNLHIDDLRSQKAAKLAAKTWAVPVEATVVLRDNATGKVVDTQKLKLMNLPKITRRFSHIIDGEEYQVDNQWRLKPGIYSMVKADGRLESHFNSSRGFKIHFDPADRKFTMNYGTSNIPLHPLLREAGIPQEQVEKVWGKEISDANQENQGKALLKFYRASTGENTQDMELARNHFWQAMEATKLNPAVTKLTLGKEHTQAGGQALLDASEKLLSIARGTAKSDPRDALVFKDLHSLEDFAQERIQKGSRDIFRRVRNVLDKKDKVRDIIGPDVFNSPMKLLFTKNTLSNVVSQVNPLEMMSNHVKTTITGDGGIKSEHVITEDAKLIDPSHLGFLDPIHTPEGASTGVTLRLPIGARKSGHDVLVRMVNLKTGKSEDVDPAGMMKSHVVLPDQVRWEKGKPVPIASKVKISGPGNEIYTGPIKDADYVMNDPFQLFSFSSNLVPFLAADHPNRSTMAGRHMEQAVSLKHREAPLVQSLAANRTFEDLMGRHAAHKSSIDGQVEKVTSDAIIIKGTDGKKYDVHLYDNFPLNENKAFLHSTPLVKPGDTVKVGQTLADSNFSKDGTLALGTNLRVGYMPYKGYNYEDGVVISESAAQKLTSEHLYRHGLEKGPDHVFDKNLYQMYMPQALTREHAAKLGDDGIIKPGQKVMPGDTLIAALRSSTSAEGLEDAQLGKLHRSVVRPYRDNSVKWDSDYSGTVAEVVKRGDSVTVHVRSDRPVEIGDKVAGRHGNKGIVASILPDHEMPKTKDGRPLDLLMNPIGIAGRTNVGQVLEVAAGKIAEKTGKPYTVKNFLPGVDLHQQVSEDLKKHGLTDKEDVIDPQTGRVMGQALVGPQHILKLHHEVDKKLRFRAGGFGYAYDRNAIPRGGGPAGAQALGTLGLYSMLAHGSVHNLREMQTLKSDSSQGDAFWSALQAGEMLPTPKPTFAYEKFMGYMKALGVNPVKEGNSLILKPFTDKHVKAMSNGEITDMGKWVVAKTLRPEEGGLFDPRITGGTEGTKWAHYKLPEAFPNPLFESAILSLTGLKGSDFDKLVSGTHSYDPKTGNIAISSDGLTGPKAIEHILSKIDVKKDLADSLTKITNPKIKDARLDQLNKRIKFLQALDKVGVTPRDAYMVNNLPILPPAMRPLSVLPNGTISEDDVNGLYKNIHLSASRYQQMSPMIPEDDPSKVEIRKEVYDGLKALAGLGGYPHQIRRGITDVIAGKMVVDARTGRKDGSPKDGFFQDQLVQRKQDLSMRSTIVPEPSLSLDEVGLPKPAAMEIYKPFVVRELRGLLAVSPLQAQEHFKKGGELVDRALERVMSNRPVLLKRDPCLHKYSVQAFKPRLVSGKAVQIHPLVTAGFNADFDGDCTKGEIIVVTPTDSRYAATQEELRVPHIGAAVSYGIVDLADFPHLPESAKKKASGVVEYDVPQGIYVPGYVDGEIKILPVSKYSVHPKCEEWVIKTRNDREIVCSSDHSLALLDPETLKVTKRPPRDAQGMCLPVMRNLAAEDMYSEFTGVKVAVSGRQMLETIPVDQDSGWFLGATIGDGWVTTKGRAESKSVHLAHGEGGEEVQKRWELLARQYSDGAQVSLWNNPHEYDGHDCISDRTTISSTALGRWLEPLIGKGAVNKHLPPHFLEMPDEFRRGLFCGLIDTDGTVNWSARGQFSLAFSTTSRRLSQELILLGLSLGLPSSRTKSRTPAGKSCWVITFSIRPVQDATWMTLTSPHKYAALLELRGGDRVEFGRNDFVPLTDRAREELLEHLRTLGASVRPPERNAAAFSQYVVLQRQSPTLTRTSAQKLRDLLVDVQLSEYLSQWFQVVLDPTVGWDVVEEAAPTGEMVEMYDLTVPGSWTFMMANGAVVWDTMAAFVPVSTEAVHESYNMLPSRNLFNPATGKLMYTPTHEAKLGLYGITQKGQLTNKSFTDYAELESAHRKGSVHLNDQVKVGGLHSTVGRFMVAGALPEPMRKPFLMKDTPLSSSDQTGLLEQVAKDHHGDYGHVANKLKDLGNLWSTNTAFSLGLKDVAPLKKERDRILAEADAKVSKLTGPDTLKKTVQIYDAATQELHTHLAKVPEKDSNIMVMHNVGLKGGMDTIRQLRAAPMLMSNAKGEVIPTPVRKSYAEGLDVADYWISMSGARKGIIQKVQSVQEPGYVTKQVMNSVMNNLIVDHDCGTDKGIALSVDEKDIMDRYLAADIKAGNKTYAAGTLITPEIRSSLRNNKVGKVVVRSPLRCLHGPGICQKCYGLSENGRLPDKGINVGILAGHAIGERSTQLALKSFHTGGTYSSKSGLVDEFERVQNLLNFPKTLPGSATLSTVAGKVTAIAKDPAGGHDVYVDGKKHYVPASRGIPMYGGEPIAVGAEIKKGAPISNGPINPHEMLELTGVEAVQGHLASELHNMFADQGLRRRHHEVVVKALTNLTKIEDPGSAHGLIRGDFVPTSYVAALNRKMSKEDKPVVHKPILKGVKMLPLEMQEDWIAKLNHERLQETIQEAAQKGWTSNIHSVHPIPAVVYGAEIGKGKPGEY